MTHGDSRAIGQWHKASLDSPVDGISIRFAFLKPLHKKPGRAVLLLNGRSEWIEKYARLPELLTVSDDTMWITLDHRGQGESGGPKAFVNSYDDYVEDAISVIDATAEGLPYAIISHSMGGLVAMHGTLSGRFKPVALGLCSPLFSLPNHPLPRVITRRLAQAIAMTKFRQQPTGVGTDKRQAFAGNPLTSSVSGFNLVQNSPHLYVAPSFGWIDSTFDACAGILNSNNLKNLTAPVRIIGGGDERVIDPSGWSSWCMAAAQHAPSVIEFVRIGPGRHELLNEIPRIRNRCVTLLQDWLQRYLLQPTAE